MQNSCPNISQLSPFRQNKTADSSSDLRHLQCPGLELPADNNTEDQAEGVHGTPGHLPLYRTLSTGTVRSRRSSEVTRSLVGYFEDLKEIKKENFDLKLKVFFLEERLGVGIGGESMKKLSENNIELKIKLRQCREDVENKSSLIKEAILAIDECEKKIRHLEDQIEALENKENNHNDNETERRSVRHISSQTSIEYDIQFSHDADYEEFSDETLFFAEALGTENIFIPEYKEKAMNCTPKDSLVAAYEKIIEELEEHKQDMQGLLVSYSSKVQRQDTASSPPDKTSMRNVELYDTLPDPRESTETNENKMENFAVGKPKAEEGSPTDIKQFTNMKKLNLLFTKKHLFKTGLFLVGAIALGCVSTRCRLSQYCQDSISVTYYAANGIFYPLNPFMYSNYWS
eukprot:GFUD01021595.1.p1 GENE.GFUD01021595.1~~GFUD01021595.1.p1  ORF type:complete len:424 (-),score=104.66 GFUD01021595.1:36-1238(-)